MSLRGKPTSIGLAKKSDSTKYWIFCTLKVPSLTFVLTPSIIPLAFLDSSIRQSGRLLTARFEVRVLIEELFRKKIAFSSMGKGEVDAMMLILLAHVLQKPLGYFYPSYLYNEIKQEELTPFENELIIHFREIWDEQIQTVAINQVKALSEFDPTKTLWDAVDITVSEKERETKIEEFINKRHKRSNKK
jgi:hypothetical protein